MLLLAISEKIVGLSLSIYRWKALPEQNIIMEKYFTNTLLSSNPNRIKNARFCPRGFKFSKFSQMKVLFLPIANV